MHNVVRGLPSNERNSVTRASGSQWIRVRQMSFAPMWRTNRLRVELALARSRERPRRCGSVPLRVKSLHLGAPSAKSTPGALAGISSESLARLGARQRRKRTFSYRETRAFPANAHMRVTPDYPGRALGTNPDSGCSSVQPTSFPRSGAFHGSPLGVRETGQCSLRLPL